ncbi:hypothetical protein SESBI_45772 [Sesbania bispinosa]|nr:hypothetical protein SESBI_45772 [Sesbania bispinosa]
MVMIVDVIGTITHTEIEVAHAAEDNAGITPGQTRRPIIDHDLPHTELLRTLPEHLNTVPLCLTPSAVAPPRTDYASSRHHRHSGLRRVVAATVIVWHAPIAPPSLSWWSSLIAPPSRWPSFTALRPPFGCGHHCCLLSCTSESQKNDRRVVPSLV